LCWAAEIKGATKMAVACTSGVIAGVAAAIISHPADTLLSKVNKAGAGGEGSIATRLGRIAGEIGGSGGSSSASRSLASSVGEASAALKLSRGRFEKIDATPSAAWSKNPFCSGCP
jgi:hypothetical protein